MRNTLLYSLILLLLTGINRYSLSLYEIETQKDYYQRNDIPMMAYGFSWIFIVVLLFVLFVHFQRLLEKNLEYESFKLKREHYITTLSEARDNNRELEALDILKKTINWNDDLVDKQIALRHFFKCEYIDARFNDLEPIK